MPAITKVISITNFAVASSALCFQVTVLYPWHKELDENFEKLKKEHLQVLDQIKKGADVQAALNASKFDSERKKGHSLREWFGLGPRSLE